MASSKKPASDLLSHVASVLQDRVKSGQHLVVGLSGGLDSVSLLDILNQLRHQLGFRLSALHINHQISAHAPQWAIFCQEWCEALQVPFRREVVELHGKESLGLEAAAREARYQVFAGQNAEFVVLAHHLDDQAETVLLQLLRGAGLRGLSGMPELRQAGGLRVLRPFLDVPRAEILAYAQLRGLRWVEDESNVELAYGRNFLRHEINPRLVGRFPAYRQTLARAAGHFAESARLLDDLAQLDAAGAIRGDHLSVAALRQLDQARAKNLLRYFLSRMQCTAPSAIQLDEMLRQLCEAAPDAKVRVRWGGYEIQRFRGEIHVLADNADIDSDLVWCWLGEKELELQQLGVKLQFTETDGAGICLAKLAGKLEVRLRQGGESLQPDCRRPRRSLKKLLQETDVAPWLRQRLPLLFHDSQLVWAPGLGVDCTFQAEPGELGLVVSVLLLPN